MVAELYLDWYQSLTSFLLCLVSSVLFYLVGSRTQSIWWSLFNNERSILCLSSSYTWHDFASYTKRKSACCYTSRKEFLKLNGFLKLFLQFCYSWKESSVSDRRSTLLPKMWTIAITLLLFLKFFRNNSTSNKEITVAYTRAPFLSSQLSTQMLQ